MIKVAVEEYVDLHDADKKEKTVKTDNSKNLGIHFLSDLKINKSERSVVINGKKYGIVQNVYGGEDDTRDIFDDSPSGGQLILVINYPDYKKYKGYHIVITDKFVKNLKITPYPDILDEK